MRSIGSTSIVEILSSFNPKMQFKDIEYAIKSKVIELFNQKGLNLWQH